MHIHWWFINGNFTTDIELLYYSDSFVGFLE